MKKWIIAVVIIAGALFTAQAQKISDNALGLRLGDNKGFGTEINYQRAIGNANRLEFGLGWHSHKHYNSFKFTGLYQWVWLLDGNFNWYAGAGAGLGSVSVDSGYDGSDEVFALAAGNIGIEYLFDIPLQLSLDFRPEIGISNYGDDLNFDIGLGIRYCF